jgi:hypothetical protein
MAQNQRLATFSFWAKIGPWLWRRIYPYVVPSHVRRALNRSLTSDLAVLRARTSSYDADSWRYLSVLLAREDPITGFDTFSEVLEFELRIAGVGFPARTTSRGAVRCGKGWGGYVHVDKLGKLLGEIDAWREDGVRRRTRSNANAVIDAFVSVIIATGDAARTEAFDAVAHLEDRTRSVADTVTKARAMLRDASAREVEAQGAFDVARLGADGEQNPDASKLDAALAIMRRRAASVRTTIRESIGSLSAPQAAVLRLLDDAAVSDEWRRVESEAAAAHLSFQDIRARLEALQPWHLTAWQEHPDKRELFQRMNRQLVVARRLGTAEPAP